MSVEIPNEYLCLQNTSSDEKTWYYYCKKCNKNTLNFEKEFCISFLEHPLIETEQIFKNDIKHIRLECGKCGSWLGWKEHPPINYIMPFGKFQGEKLKNIPTEYLEWLEENIELKGKLKDKIKNALDIR